MKITALNIRKHVKLSLCGYFDLELDGLLTIRGCSFFRKHDHCWIAMPAKSYVDRDGTTKWQAIVEMPKERMARLTELVLPALKAALLDTADSPSASPVPSAAFAGMPSATARPEAGRGKGKVDGSDWEPPLEAGDLSGIGVPGGEIPF